VTGCEHVLMRNERTAGSVYVVAQFALLAALLLIPRGDLWPVTAPARGCATTAGVGGVLMMFAGLWGIRRSASVLPQPSVHAQLRTSGAYRWCRHPIYFGLLLVAAGMVLSRAHPLAVVVWLTLCIVLVLKSRFEESLLRRRFPAYGDYARRTPMLVPLLRRRTR
jgi:protein-S-isoprenylcysteine O-methyltransferase Ste14